LLSFFPESTVSFQYRLNGQGWHTQAWPYPDSGTFAWRTLALPLPLSEVVAGSNRLELQSSEHTWASGTVVANVDLLLVGAGGLPGGGTVPPPSTVQTPGTVQQVSPLNGATEVSQTLMLGWAA